MSEPQPGTIAARLARLRVPLGFLSGAVVLWLAAPTRDSLAVGAAVASAGEALRIWAAGHLNKSREVTASGPYRWLAHPLYVGSSVMGLGVAIAAASVPVALLIGVYLAATITAATRHEEAFLRARFGGEYDAYRRGGAARVAGQQGEAADLVDRAPRTFSLAQAITNREYRAAAGLVAAVLLLLLKATYNGTF